MKIRGHGSKFAFLLGGKSDLVSNHSTLLKRNLEDRTNLAPRSPFNREPSKKRAHISPCIIFGFLSTSNKFKKDDAPHVDFLENVMFVIKGLMFMKIVESILL
jgi:hypothetical protein